MENLFSNQNVEETVAGGKKYIYPGIYDEITISSVVAGASKTKQTPYIGIKMHSKEGGEANGKEFQFYMSEKAYKMSKTKIKHIATKVNTLEAFEAIEATDIQDYATKLSAILTGRKLRMKFTGSQYENAQGDIKDTANIGLPEFAEAIQAGAKYPPVAKEDSKLTYDENNSYDFEKLNVTPTNEANVEATENDDPFAQQQA